MKNGRINKMSYKFFFPAVILLVLSLDLSLLNGKKPPFIKITYTVENPYKSVKGNRTVFRKTFEDSSLDGFTGIACEGSNGITVVDRGETSNTRAVLCTIGENGSAAAAESSSSELIYANNDPEGSSVWYAWSLYIPDDFSLPSDYAVRSIKPEIIAGRWLDQPDFLSGKMKGSSTALGYYIGHDGKSFTLELKGSYPNKQKSNESFAVKTGEWMRIVTRVKWSTGSDGIAETFLDGEKKAAVFGKNMGTHFPVILRLGIYGDRTFKKAFAVAYDDIQIGYEEKDIQ